MLQGQSDRSRMWDQTIVYTLCCVDKAMGVLSPDLESSGSHAFASTRPPPATLVFVFAVVFICSCSFLSQCVCICICVFAVDDVVCHMSQPRLWLDSGLTVSHPGIFWSAFLANSNSSWSVRLSNLWQIPLCVILNSYLLFQLRLMYIIINSTNSVVVSKHPKNCQES